jgi:hypothetical protein
VSKRRQLGARPEDRVANNGEQQQSTPLGDTPDSADTTNTEVMWSLADIFASMFLQLSPEEQAHYACPTSSAKGV